MKRKFFVRNFIFVAFPAILVAVLLGAMAVYLTIDTTRDEITRNQEQKLNQIKDNLEVIFSDADAQSLNYSTYPYVIGQLKMLLENGFQNKEYLDINKMLRPFLDSSVNSKPFLHSIYLYLYNGNGNFFASGIGLANALNHRDTEWMDAIKGVDDSRKQWLEVRTTSAYQKSNYDVEVLTLYKRLYSPGVEKPVGTLLMNIRKDYLEELLNSNLEFSGQTVMIVSGDEILVQAGTTVNYPRMTEKERNSYFVTELESPGYEVKFIAMTPKGTLLGRASGLIRVVGYAIFLSLALGIWTAFLTTRHNARNVRRITDIFEAAEKGQSLPEVSDHVNDEYGYIIQNVVKNFVEKQYLCMQLAEKSFKLEGMYFYFLQSQLNPHFLFNTLKNIFWKTVRLTGGQNEASRMIDLLTTLLYYALVQPDKFVMVSEEIKMTNCYLEIQQLRFDFRFKVIWNCEPEIQSVKIIKFILQPLVENSVSHGFDQSETEGEINITVKRKGEALYFAVEDNGKGLEYDHLERIKAQLMEEDTPEEGIGLYNLNKRLTLTYGENAGLLIESEPGVYTRVSFCITADDKK